MNNGRIYTVHYGDNVLTTQKFIGSICPYLNDSLDLVIINNSRGLILTQEAHPYIYILESDTNLGYFGAIKFGIERHPCDNLDYIIVCNNDTRIINDDFISILLAKLLKYEVIAPSIIIIDKKQQNPHRRYQPGISVKIYYRIYFISFLLARLITWIRKRLLFVFLENKKLTQEHEIFSPHGAFIIFSANYFKKGGILDNGFFMYGEEVSIGAICKEKNMKVGFVPELEIFHQESTTIGLGLSRNKYKFQKRAYYYIKNKYSWVYSLWKAVKI